MPTEPSLESFWELLHRSGVIHENNLQPLREEYERDFSHLDGAKKVADDLVAREMLTGWQASMILQGRHKGFFLGPYRLLDLLGKGGMGSVYLAEHQLMRRRSAVKVLPSKKIYKPSMLERFTREAQAVAALDHPNIVRAYEFNKELLDKTEVYYLAMEFVEGQDLQALVEKEGVLDYVRAADFIRQAALGLAHAHEAGLVHRDVKPANLLVDIKGVVKLLDLGLVKSFHNSDEASSLTGEHENTVLGTADYLAPEQAVSSRDVDYRADIYSLGYTFYFSLTGHPPYPEGTIHQRMAAHGSRHAEPIIKDRPDAPDDIVEIISKMVSKHPVDRYQSAKDVCDAVSDWIFDHADDDWLLDHPSVIDGDRSSLPNSPAALEPTHPVSSAYDETELDLLPLDDEEPAKSRAKKPAGVRSSEQNGSNSDGADGDARVNENDEPKQQDASGAAAASSLPPLERDRIGTLLSSEPNSPAGRELRPIEPLRSPWSIVGMAQRLQIPPSLVVFALVLLLTLIFGVGYLVLSSVGSNAPSAETSRLLRPAISDPASAQTSTGQVGSAIGRLR